MQLLTYEDFKIFTLRPTYSLTMHKLIPKTIGHFCGAWAI